MKPLEPLAVPWTMKPLESARTRVDELDDGRMRYSIDHDVLHGVTPEMLVWWFSNMEGNVRIEGVPVPRYRAWHPRDHVAFRYHRRPARPFDGAVFEIHEVIGRRYEVDIVTDVRRLDDGGFRHFPRRRPAVMDYTFERVPGGTRYRNSLTVGFPRGLRALNRVVGRLAFDEAHGRAWLLHNVEEVGNFEHFLPDLWAGKTACP